jgi:hypothetical protein
LEMELDRIQQDILSEDDSEERKEEPEVEPEESKEEVLVENGTIYFKYSDGTRKEVSEYDDIEQIFSSR